MPTPPSSTAERTTSNRRKTKKDYRGKHCYWTKWMSGKTCNYWSTIAQDNDPIKLRGMLRRIFEGNMHKVAIIHHYYDEVLIKKYLSDHQKWFTPQEHQAYLEAKRQERRKETLENKPEQLTKTAQPHD